MARRPQHCVLSFVVVCLAALVLPLQANAAAADTSLDVRLVAQNFNVATNRQLRFVFAVTSDSQRAALANDPSAELTIGFHPAFTSREDVRSAIEGGATGIPIASVDLRFRQLTRNAAGDFVAITSLVGSLRTLPPSVYPVSLVISQAEQPVSSMTTVINLYSPDTTFETLPVSTLLSVDSQPTMQPDGSTDVPVAARAQLGNLAALLESVDASLSLHLSPQLLDGVRRSTLPEDQELLARLAAVLPRHELLPNTFVSFDAASAERNAMTDEFAEQLLQGESIIDLINGDAPLSRRVWVSRVSIDRDAVSLLRQLGVQTVVLTPQAAGSVGRLDSYVKPYRVVGLTSSVSVGLRTVDPSHAQWLNDQTRDPIINAYALAAEIILQQQSIVEAGGAPQDRHVVVSTQNGNLAPLSIMNPLVIALDRAPQLRLVPLAEMDADVSDATTVNLPTTDRVNLGERRETINQLRAEISSTATMLLEDAPQHLGWKISLLTTATDTLTTEQFDAYVRGLRAQLRSLRNSVQIPEALTFTLGGRESDLRLQLRNDADQLLSVLVSVESAKLQFPNGPQLVAVPARSSIDVVIPVIARANGTFPLEIVLSTPDGSTAVGRRVEMTARVSALAGLGQVVTGAAVLILLSWWVSHWRAKRRNDSVKNHPAVH